MSPSPCPRPTFIHSPEGERICRMTLVCKKWYELIYGAAVWSKVNFDYQRRITSDILEKFIYPGTAEIFLTECHYLKWSDLVRILSRCRNLKILALAWIGYRKETVPLDFTEVLHIWNLHFLDLSHCKVTNSVFKMLPLKCPILKVLIVQDCQEITMECYITSAFKKHKHLRLLIVAYNLEALSTHCVIELLKYSYNNVLLDIRGHHFRETDFQDITREHHDALQRIRLNTDDYQYIMPYSNS